MKLIQPPQSTNHSYTYAQYNKPLYKGHNLRSQDNSYNTFCISQRGKPLYCIPSPKCPLFGGATVHTYSIYVQYIHTVYTYSTYVQYIRTVHTYSTYVQYIHTVHTYSKLIQYMQYKHNTNSIQWNLSNPTLNGTYIVTSSVYNRGRGVASTPKNSNCSANYYREGPTWVSKSTLNGLKWIT